MKGEMVLGRPPRKRSQPQDRSGATAATRPSFFDFDVTKMMADFRFRPIDLESLMAYQRRNIEALSQANQLAVEDMQSVAKRQIEMARQAIEDVSALFRDLGQSASVEDRIARNTEYAKQMLERSVAQGREIAMLATKAGTEAADVLRRRATEGLDELSEIAEQQAATEENLDEPRAAGQFVEWNQMAAEREAEEAADAFRTAAKNLLFVADDALAAMRSRRDQTQALLSQLEKRLETPRG